MLPVGARPDGRQTFPGMLKTCPEMFAKPNQPHPFKNHPCQPKEIHQIPSMIARQDGLLQVFYYNSHSFVTAWVKCTSSVA
jgi:hypothetical protein